MDHEMAESFEQTKVNENGKGNAYIPIMSMPINMIDAK